MNASSEEEINLLQETDNRLFGLFKKQAALSDGKKNEKAFFNPGAEAARLERIMALNKGKLPNHVISKFWRTLISAENQIRNPFSVAVYTKDGQRRISALAADYFGALTPFVFCSASAAQVFQKLNSGEVAAGVFPLFDQCEEAWWSSLISSTENPRALIVAKLPFLSEESDHGEDGAFVVSFVDRDETGRDVSLFALETDTSASIGTLKEELSACGFSVCRLYPAVKPFSGTVHIAELKGYFTDTDKRISLFKQRNRERLRSVNFLGGYPSAGISENKGLNNK